MKEALCVTVNDYIIEWLKEKALNSGKSVSICVNEILKEAMRREGVNISELEEKSKVKLGKIKKTIIYMLYTQGEMLYTKLLRELTMVFPRTRPAIFRSFIKHLIDTGWLEKEIVEYEMGRRQILRLSKEVEESEIRKIIENQD